MIDGSRALNLFGGHVVDGAKDHAGAGQPGAIAGSDQLGQTEIGDLHPAATVEQDVLGLDVAVDDAGVMGVLQRIAQLRYHRQGLARTQPAGAQHLAQRRAFDQLHHQIAPFAGPADIVDRHQIGMIEPGQGQGLAFEPSGERRIAAQLGGQDFQGHRPVEPFLPRAIHRTHAALSDQGLNRQIGQDGGKLFGLRRSEPAGHGRGRDLGLIEQAFSVQAGKRIGRRGGR